MSNQWIRCVVGATGLLLLMWVVTPVSLTAAKDELPAGIGANTIAADVAFLEKGLSKDPQKREIPTLKAVAMLLALHAQNNLDGKDGDKMAALRAQALKIAEALAKKDIAGAKTAAAGLSDPKGGDKKPLKLDTMHKLDLDEVMSCFRKSTVGGLNIEADIRSSAKAVTDPKAIGILAGRVNAVAEYTQAFAPDNAKDGAKKKQWDEWSKEMGVISKDIATEAAKGDKASKPELSKKLKALDTNCTACHNVFKN